jgi:hypothetical protein
MRRMTMALALAAAILAGTVAPLAANKPSAPKPPKPTMTKTQAPKVSAPKPAKVSAPKPAKVSAPKAPKASAPKAAKVSAPKAAKASAPKAAKASTSTTTKASTTSAKARTTTPTMTTLATPGTWTPTNPIAQKLSTKPNQLAKLQSVLPLGTNLNLATLGFKNFGQLNAAVNNSINHNIPFADLKAAMTGIRLDGTRTGLAPVSLGQAKKQITTTTTPLPPRGDE